MSAPTPFNVFSTFLRLRPDASAEVLPVDGTFWQRISTGALGDFHNEFLVAGGSYEGDWPMWEMHPNGDELVCLLSGSVTFLLEQNQGHAQIDLTQGGDYVLVPKGVWHTAKAHEPSRLVFVTPGEGTQRRPV